MWNNWEKWKWKVNAGQNSLRSLSESWSWLWKVFWRSWSTEHSSRAAGASAAASILQRPSVHLPLCRSCCTAWSPDWEPAKLIINVEGWLMQCTCLLLYLSKPWLQVVAGQASAGCQMLHLCLSSAKWALQGTWNSFKSCSFCSLDKALILIPNCIWLQ